jgi:hypothetical protein
MPNPPAKLLQTFRLKKFLIKEYLNEKKKIYKEKYEHAKTTNTLLECGCCYNAELIDEDMLSCDSDHKFCK